MKIKSIVIIATLTALLCCKSETNVKKNSRQNVARRESKDSSKQPKITVVKNNEYFLLNDRKID
ncbi:MAG: hypothetical protein DCE86_08355 [Flavobacteriaceae bacterium]|nr:MAG: hypothetical protein DCE86_08355 [Flavobacteriaceae bacterium]